MIQELDLARQALRAAIRARRQAGIAEDVPISIFDFAERYHDVEVWFVDVPSLEGMYQRGEYNRILISSHRSPGRQSMTGAHELGHHIFGHGTMVDEYLEDHHATDSHSPQERLASLFAANLIMPYAAVQQTFHALSAKPADCASEIVYIAAQFLGCSYEGLVRHMRWSLKLIGDRRHNELLKHSPKSIKKAFLGEYYSGELFVADTYWIGRAIDLRMDDLLILPVGIRADKPFLERLRPCAHGDLYRAASQGITQVQAPNADWSAHVRITRPQFVGRNIYRHMEDPDADR